LGLGCFVRFLHLHLPKKICEFVTIVYTAPAGSDIFFENICFNAAITCIKVSNARKFMAHPYADLYIDASFDGYFAEGATPLIFNAPAKTFKLLPNAPLSSARFCAWHGFWERTKWEIAPKQVKDLPMFKHVLKCAGITLLHTPDIPGLIGPRILCTIINEAVYTLSDRIASANDIDIAMKLGTNYPLGPLEWAERIGIDQIIEVLEYMSQEDSKYQPHPQLKFILKRD